MTEYVEQTVALFRDRLAVDVTDEDTDLIDSGLMDSLILVDLLTLLEEEFEITIDLADLEIDSFRTAASIAGFVEARTAGTATA